LHLFVSCSGATIGATIGSLTSVYAQRIFSARKAHANHQLAGWNLSEKWNSYEIAASAWPLRA
jgi:hypothetical protein